MMKNKQIIGIIMELNPLHNGHKYLIQKIKNDYPESKIVVITSGYFTMRGVASIMPKDEKVKQLLKLGVDLIAELPIHKTLNSAELFASESIKILKALNINYLAFGIEKGTIDDFNRALSIINNDEYQEEIINFAKEYGYKKAISECLKKHGSQELYDLSMSPNNVLALEYLKNLDKSITPILVKRVGSDDSDLKLTTSYPSGSAIRNGFQNGIDIQSFIPYDASILNKIDENKLCLLIKSLLVNEKQIKTKYQTNEGIENYLFSTIDLKDDYQSMIKKLANKKYTESRIKRQLLTYLLNLEKDDENTIRILGFTKEGSELIKGIKDYKVFSSLKDANTNYYHNEYNVAIIYELITSKSCLKSEFMYPLKEETWKN